MQSLDLDLASALSRAVARDELVVHFQPEIDLATGAVVGMEALLRWQHPQRGLLWPADFLAIAERCGLLPAMGWEVMRRCAAERESWRSLPNFELAAPRQLWVNVSASQLMEATFAERVATLVAEHDLAPGELGLEIAHETLAAGSRYVPALLCELREAGVAIAIDDVGSWYESLGTLGDLPVEAVKLDRRFVRGVGGDLDGDAIVASVVALAHRHGLRVVAEGVESWTEGARLCDLGCDRAHGYLFAGPQIAAQARLLLAHGAGWTTPRQRESSDSAVCAPTLDG